MNALDLRLELFREKKRMERERELAARLGQAESAEDFLRALEGLNGLRRTERVQYATAENREMYA